MIKLLWLIVLASLACRLIAGRWPWQFLIRRGPDTQQLERARRHLGVAQDASRMQIIEAHRRVVAAVHPDRGGSSEGVHAANEARDILLNALDSRSEKP
jgi:DnaJ homolog subfamily C member 19